jgi:hypothetical protein
VDSATFNYSHLMPSLLYVDRDELLFCPEGSYDINTQRQYQHSLLNRTLQRRNTRTGHVQQQLGGSDQILFQRFNYASVMQIPPLSSSTPLSDQFIQQVLESCLLDAYRSATSDRGGSVLSSYFRCFSSVSAFKTKEKSIYRADSCPFHELHYACLRCNCQNYQITRSRPGHSDIKRSLAPFPSSLFFLTF